MVSLLSVDLGLHLYRRYFWGNLSERYKDTRYKDTRYIVLSVAVKPPRRSIIDGDFRPRRKSTEIIQYSLFIIHYSLLNIHTLSRSVSKTEKAPQGGAFFGGGNRGDHSEAFSR
jgi:hypothetical protein